MTTSLADPGTALQRCIAVINAKGGTGKTSTVANIGGLAAAAGHRTLLVDLDPQGNLAVDLGYSGDDGKGLYGALTLDVPFAPLTDVRPDLDVLPGGRLLEDLAAVAAARTARGGADLTQGFRHALAAAAQPYDLVLIDCPPGLRVLQDMALGASAYALIPTRTDEASLAGMSLVADRFTAARTANPGLQLLGVVLWGVTRTATRVRTAVRASVQADLGATAPVFETVVRYVEAAAVDARRRGQLIHELEADVAKAPKFYERLRAGTRGASEPLAPSASGLAEDYAALTREVLSRLAALEAVPA